MPLTLQAFLENQWIDIASLSFPNEDDHSYTINELNYNTDYAVEHLAKDDHHAASLNQAVSLFFSDAGQPHWLKFLDDIMPSGASRRYWLKHLDIESLPVDYQNYILLKHGTISPIGNLRIKDSLPQYNYLAQRLLFSIDDVKDRASDFLDYAQEKGAAAGGATGAGGEAPKLLLRMNSASKVWIDTYQEDLENQDIHYLVKYPRGSRSQVDCNILRAEFYYYQELTSIGFNTIPVENMRLEEGSNYPSLWLPRFDVVFQNDGSIERYAMESVYSILDKSGGVTLYHEDTIRALVDKITHSHMVVEQGFDFDVHEFVIEWVRRDLLNIIFGNSDNHGRNTSFIRYNGSIRLTPIYDFAPMKADPEGIARTMKWYQPLETGGEYDFIGIADELADLIPSEILLQALKETARQLVDLKSRLEHRGVPDQIINMPSIGFDFISEKLTRWGLL